MIDIPIQAVLFDMDGLMFDTERISFQSFQKAGKSCGVKIDKPLFERMLGRNKHKILSLYAEAFGSMAIANTIMEKKDIFAAEYIEAHGVPVKPGLYELLQYLKKTGLRAAVASSSNREVVLHLLKLAKVDTYFTAVCCGNEVQHAKPNPEIFLKAAAQLDTDPKACLVLEDSVNGLKAAHRAGICSIMVPDLLPPTDETRALTPHVAKSLLDVIPFLEVYGAK